MEQKMIDYVGNVKLNYEHYSGNDLYSDGEIENELLEIVSTKENSDYNNVIRNSKTWPVLYHLSPIRENILNWYPFTKEDTVLEIGAGCGAISGCLARNSKKVTAIELSKQRSLINANKNKKFNNLEIMVGNFEDVSSSLNEKFDYITLIGVLEYAASYINSDKPYVDFLLNVKELLNENGQIIIAIENRLGLKYFAGCREDHVGMFFEGIEGYTNTSGVKTFSRNELINLFNECGFNDFDFYYPYPDYKLPEKIYSDECLPKKGELVNNIRNFDSDRMILFDESKAFDSLIDAGLFSEFSNSFLVFLRK